MRLLLFEQEHPLTDNSFGCRQSPRPTPPVPVPQPLGPCHVSDTRVVTHSEFEDQSKPSKPPTSLVSGSLGPNSTSILHTNHVGVGVGLPKSLPRTHFLPPSLVTPQMSRLPSVRVSPGSSLRTPGTPGRSARVDPFVRHTQRQRPHDRPSRGNDSRTEPRVDDIDTTPTSSGPRR